MGRGIQIPSAVIHLLWGWMMLTLFASCKNGENFPPPMDESPYLLEIPKGFPTLQVPEENKLTPSRVKLGRLLFYDPILSRDSTVSCGSCHRQKHAFADANRLAVGIEGRVGKRNVPSLVNSGFHPYFFFEGGSPSLEAQALGPIEHEDEHGFNAKLLVDRLRGNPFYEEWSHRAYGREMSLFVIVSSLASFERTLISAESPYDLAMRGDSSLMSPAQWRGKELFFSSMTQCATCHSPPLFTDFSFQNIGLEEEYLDLGRYRVSLKEEDKGKFKVPSLRNVSLTPPYMHDGRFQHLSEVIDHFVEGGKGHKNQSTLIRPFELSDQEKQDLIAFLEALSDKSVLSEPAWAP